MDSERMLHWIYEAGGLKLWQDYNMDKFGLVSMPLFCRTAEAFLHSRKPVHTLDDLKGLKLRTAGAWLEISKQLGAAPVTMPGGDVYAGWSAVPSTPPNGARCTRTSRRASTRSPSTRTSRRPPALRTVRAVHQQGRLAALSDREKTLVDMAAKLVTLESWMRIGQEDAKALQFYKDHGNEIIELEPAVQKRAKELAVAWAEKQAENNAWFDKILKNQMAFEDLWKNAASYRNVRYE